MKKILFILIAFMLCSVTAQAKKKVSMKRVACITISVNPEEFETDDGVNYFVGEFCAFCEQNGIAARVNNTTGTINRTTIRQSFGHSIYLATTRCWTHYYTNVTLYCSGADNVTISLGTIKAANFRGQLVKKLGKLIKFE